MGSFCFPAFRHACATLRVGSRKRSEVVFADDMLRRADDGFFVHGIGVMKNVSRQEWRAYVLAINAIAVGFRLGGMPRVEVVRDHLHAIHPHRSRKDIVQRHDQVSLWNRTLEPHRCDLGQRMDTGIGAPRALRQYLFTGEPLKALRQRALHSSQSRLDLPSVKLRSVIGQRDFEIAAHIIPGMQTGCPACGVLLSSVKLRATPQISDFTATKPLLHNGVRATVRSAISAAPCPAGPRPRYPTDIPPQSL